MVGSCLGKELRDLTAERTAGPTLHSEGHGRPGLGLRALLGKQL